MDQFFILHSHKFLLCLIVMSCPQVANTPSEKPSYIIVAVAIHLFAHFSLLLNHLIDLQCLSEECHLAKHFYYLSHLKFIRQSCFYIVEPFCCHSWDPWCSSNHD